MSAPPNPKKPIGGVLGTIAKVRAMQAAKKAQASNSAAPPPRKRASAGLSDEHMTIFSSFPVEVRIMIWRQALLYVETGRNVEILVDRKITGPRNDREVVFEYYDPAAREAKYYKDILLVSQEVRAEVEGIISRAGKSAYSSEIRSLTPTYHHGPKEGEEQDKIFYHPKYDTIVMSDEAKMHYIADAEDWFYPENGGGFTPIVGLDALIDIPQPTANQENGYYQRAGLVHPRFRMGPQ